MKRILYIAFAAATLFVGCQQNIGLQEGEEMVNFKINLAPDATSKATDEGELKRYIVEARYVDNSTVVLHTEATSGDGIEVTLPKGEYDFAFWADEDGSHYDAADLYVVSPAHPNGTPAVGYAGLLGEVVVDEDFSGFDVTLTRPVARIDMRNTAGSGDYSFECAYSFSNLVTAYDVYTGETTEQAVECSCAISGNYGDNDQVFDSYYVFPPKSGKLDFTLEISAESFAKDISAAVKPNYITNVKMSF